MFNLVLGDSSFLKEFLILVLTLYIYFLEVLQMCIEFKLSFSHLKTL
jgi:hypothetical protein